MYNEVSSPNARGHAITKCLPDGNAFEAMSRHSLEHVVVTIYRIESAAKIESPHAIAICD